VAGFRWEEALPARRYLERLAGRARKPSAHQAQIRSEKEIWKVEKKQFKAEKEALKPEKELSKPEKLVDPGSAEQIATAVIERLKVQGDR
jgi:hypothetical protein